MHRAGTRHYAGSVPRKQRLTHRIEVPQVRCHENMKDREIDDFLVTTLAKLHFHRTRVLNYDLPLDCG
jgi:hypothetical protein